MNVVDIISPSDLAELNFPSASLSEVEAQQITSRIRAWVKSYPTEDVARAYAGRIWISLGYESWSEYCDCELDGFRLPSRIERPDVVSELADAGMSQRAISEATGADRKTIRKDLAEVGESGPPARDSKVTGMDGKQYTKPRPKPAIPDEAPGIDDAPPAAPKSNWLDAEEQRAHNEADIINGIAGCLTPERIATYTVQARTKVIRVLTEALTELESAA